MPFQPKKILVATDFSEFAQHAADSAITLARPFGAQVALVHVVPLSTYVEYAGGVEGSAFNTAEFQEAVREGVRREAKTELERMRAQGMSVEFTSLDGPPALEICNYAAKNGFDLIVVGSRGRTGIKRLLLGSVAENVVRHATVPVLTVRGGERP